MSEYSVFKPKSTRGLFVDYPELKKFSKLENLRPDDILFVWFYACEASPVNSKKKETSQRDRVKESLDLSYYKSDINTISKIDADNMLDGRFSPKIAGAIEQMEKFRVGPRVRARMLTEKMLTNVETILDIDASDTAQFQNKDKEVDFAKKKAYVDTVEKGLKIIPKLISSLEGGYDLSEEKEEEELLTEGESMIDNWHDNTE